MVQAEGMEYTKAQRQERELCLGEMQITQMAIAEFESGKIVIKEARDL